MIIEEGKYYLYRHIRLDKNEVFYVGIGTKSLKKDGYNFYKRAFNVKNRTSFWKKIVNKTDYKVEIILESNNYTFLLQKEREFISLYGRRNLGLGTLVNLTNGGEGKQDRVITDQQRLNMSLSHKGKKLSLERKIKSVSYLEKGWEKKKRRCFCYDENGNFVKEFESITEASIYLTGDKTKGRQINNACKGLKNSGNNKICKVGKVLGYFWSYEKKNNHKVIIKKKWTEDRRIKFRNTFKSKSKPIKVYNVITGEQLIFNSLIELLEQNPTWDRSHILKSIKNNYKVYKKYIMTFIEK